MSEGVKVFDSISEALRQGYHVYEKSEDPKGFIVRIMTDKGWQQAMVVPK